MRRFSEILADDFLCSKPDGSLIDKQEFLRQTAPASGLSELEAHDVKIRISSSFASMRASFRLAGGKADSGRYRERRDGHWLAIAAYVTGLA